MDLNLREAILQNVKGKSVEDLREIVESSVGGQEKALPGLGILFEVIWQSSEPSSKEEMIETLQQQLAQA